VDSWKWRKWLAASLWYGGEADSGIGSALFRYDHLVGAGGVPRPDPPYCEQNGARTKRLHPNSTEAHDAVYELLATFARKSNGAGALNPLAHTMEPTDYHLPWHLLSTLVALGLTPTPHAHHHHLHYASQLEAAGLWEWAAYVFLHTNLEQGHRAALELVARHIPLLQDETHNKRFRFLTEKLHVPVSLLHEALAWRTGYEGNQMAQAGHLQQAGKWRELHHLVTSNFCPSYVLRHDVERIRPSLAKLEEHHTTEIDAHTWKTGAGLFINYLNFCQHQGDRKDDPAAAKLISNIGKASAKPSLSREQQVCFAHMARDILLQRTPMPLLMDLSRESFDLACQPLPPDSRLAILSKMSAHFLGLQHQQERSFP